MSTTFGLLGLLRSLFNSAGSHPRSIADGTPRLDQLAPAGLSLQRSRVALFLMHGGKWIDCNAQACALLEKDALTEDGVGEVIDKLRSVFDYVFCDSPAGIERGAQLAMRFADEAVIVTNPEVSSVRDSDRIIGLLDARTVKAEQGEQIVKHVLVTRYDAARAARGEMLSIDDVLEILSTPLLGIIPESQDVLKASNLGSPVTLSDPTNSAARAYIEAAKRLEGEELPVVVPFERKGFLDRLFGRRAA